MRFRNTAKVDVQTPLAQLDPSNTRVFSMDVHRHLLFRLVNWLIYSAASAECIITVNSDYSYNSLK